MWRGRGVGDGAHGARASKRGDGGRAGRARCGLLDRRSPSPVTFRTPRNRWHPNWGCQARRGAQQPATERQGAPDRKTKRLAASGLRVVGAHRASATRIRPVKPHRVQPQAYLVQGTGGRPRRQDPTEGTKNEKSGAAATRSLTFERTRPHHPRFPSRRLCPSHLPKCASAHHAALFQPPPPPAPRAARWPAPPRQHPHSPPTGRPP